MRCLTPLCDGVYMVYPPESKLPHGRLRADKSENGPGVGEFVYICPRCKASITSYPEWGPQEEAEDFKLDGG